MFDSGPEYGYDFEDDTYSYLPRCPPAEMFEQWGRIPVETKKDAAERMKVCAFWHPILLQPESSNIAFWAADVGLISHRGNDDLSLKHLCKIEILETILKAMEKGSLKIEPTRQIFLLSNGLTSDPDHYGVLRVAVDWLARIEGSGIVQQIAELGDRATTVAILQVVFTEFAKYIQEMASNTERTMKALMARPQEYLMEKCEEMKRRGNEKYQKQEYEDALKYYSRAIRHYPENHIIYGNRALCYIRCKNYLKAVVDGKRATLIKPHWAKGHYRYCEALFLLGEVKMAVKANLMAQKECKSDHDGLKDLEQQQQKFIIETSNPKAGQLKSKNKRSGSANRPGTVESQSAKANYKAGDASKAPQTKVSAVKQSKQPVKSERSTQADSSTKDSKPSKSDFSSKNGKDESSTAVRKKKNACFQSKEEKVVDSKAVCKELRSIVQDAHTALTDLRSRNAVQAFTQAVFIVESNTPEELGLSTVDVLLLSYGLVCALTDVGQPEELAKAHFHLEKIKSAEERTFHCLVYYATGRVYLKENRFAVALQRFLDSLQMVKNKITPGKLTWPLTKEIVKETELDYFKEILESAIELCKFPPIPDAICRLENCLVPFKAEIYFTDPDFKGFIRLSCCHNCIVEYHITCWKTFKTSSSSDKNDKDFLLEMCLTPDCVGKICNIQIYGQTGLLKCKFEAGIVRPQTEKKPKVNQKCTSLKKLKSKEERRHKRKQHKLSFQEKETVVNHDDILPKKEDTASQIQQKAWLLYRDRVLLQISQNMELLREEKGLQVSALTTSLKPWLELDLSRGNRLAQRMLNWQQEALQTVGQVFELLLERKNRVWARVFIQELSSCEDVNPKLNTWACKLNNAGLTAAKSFIERYAEHLEQLDLNLLLRFGPVEDLIMEKLSTTPELLSNISLTVTEYLKRAPPHDTRLFIWALEEHRDQYPSCHTILDEYFDMMDGHCSVLKKSDESDNNSLMKTKNRGRKKKQKEPKGVIILSGGRGVTPRDDWDQDYFEDDSLLFLDPAEPFSVPSHLRDQVADFERQYNGARSRSQCNNILDNNPDPTKETLYDYFAQILEEHGPLVAEDPLLVGELEHFPSVAQLNIQEAGGIEAFLLNSLRFIKMGRCIGLAKHAVSLQQAGHGSLLDELDDLEDPDTNPEFTKAAYSNCLDNYLSAEAEVYLPNPHLYAYESGPNLYSHWSNGDDQLQEPYFSNIDYGNIDFSDLMDLYTCEDGWQKDSLMPEENILFKHAAVQTCQDTMRSVAVNTELYEPFEICSGDLNKKAKHNQELEQQMKMMANGCDEINVKQKEETASLEEEIQNITTNIQVTNTELMLFQQKLEEEVKKDQKEKKANQEALKSLKLDTEKLVEEQGSLVRNIREKKKQYQAMLNDFLELGNQSAAEKMSLEDEIKRCKALLASAKRRSHTAQLSLLESTRDQTLYGFHTELADAKALLSKLNDVTNRYTNPDLEKTKSIWRATVQEVEEKISVAQTQYQQRIDQVKNGIRLSGLIPVNIKNQPEPSAAPLSVAAKEFTSQASGQMPHKAPSPVHLSAAEAPVAAAQPQHKPNRPLAPAHATVFDKAMERLATIFPGYKRSDLMRFVQEFRSFCGGSLTNMTVESVVSGVTQLILDHQDNINSSSSNAAGNGDPAHSATPPLVTPAPVWQSVGHQRTTHSSALNMEDPCIICHEDMTADDICVLECRHSFHNEVRTKFQLVAEQWRIFY
ncbi:E3 ubiquitin-protein ligase TTC3 isoform X2 [Betta splendens]|uniref:RING-type E3 ubiquitin transferase n=1 Tax=Betta splendens TaxID=158456 RepID=A0A9W2Y9C8_BETSP|nr:E3 ubiquitin-protein ligase TTC3 isoform X2 [Betta splendens]